MPRGTNIPDIYMNYRLVACGGTFDVLHQGHRSFLDFVFSAGEAVLIGITTDEYARRYKTGVYESYPVRRAALATWLEARGYAARAHLIPIDDSVGPAGGAAAIDALVVTRKTHAGAQTINRLRKRNGLAELPILVAPLITDEAGAPLSSSRIREWLRVDHLVPSSLRRQLQQPLGELLLPAAFQAVSKRIPAERLVTVGDVVTAAANRLALNQMLSVVDFTVGRQKKFTAIAELGFSGGEEVLNVSNPAGMVTAALMAAVRGVFAENIHKRRIIVIAGEEDLAVLPILLAAPFGYHVLYGQPNAGIVHIVVNEETRDLAFRLLQHFDTRSVIANR